MRTGLRTLISIKKMISWLSRPTSPGLSKDDVSVDVTDNVTEITGEAKK